MPKPISEAERSLVFIVWGWRLGGFIIPCTEDFFVDLTCSLNGHELWSTQAGAELC